MTNVKQLLTLAGVPKDVIYSRDDGSVEIYHDDSDALTKTVRREVLGVCKRHNIEIVATDKTTIFRPN